MSLDLGHSPPPPHASSLPPQQQRPLGATPITNLTTICVLHLRSNTHHPHQQGVSFPFSDSNSNSGRLGIARIASYIFQPELRTSKMDSAPTELAATIQAASIERNPDPALDTNPPTAADRRRPVTLEHVKHEHDDGIDDEDEDEVDIPYSVLRPAPRHSHLPPLPDLRFEQSYLRSISKADTWWKVALITTRDQIIMPLTQGLVYNLFLCGWQHWNRNARLHGNTLGARVRRWWWEVNNWKIPTHHKRG